MLNDLVHLASQGMKRCAICQSVKPAAFFNKNKTYTDGLSHKCKECNAAYAKEWRSKNPTAYAEWAERNRENLKSKRKEWRDENAEHRAQYISEWTKTNSARVNARIMKRYATKLRATPKWANPEAMASIYARAAEFTKLTGVRHEVDHFYPLQGKKVCGLHCEANLQILTKFENISKLNHMPEEWRGVAA